jgi:hypothetical protein
MSFEYCRQGVMECRERGRADTVTPFGRVIKFFNPFVPG